MRKLSQAIIAATLILDVAVVFTFGLAVIFSYEDGSLLPKPPVIVNYSKGRVAGATTSTCPTTANVSISLPSAGAVITSETFRINAISGTMVPTSTLMHFVYPTTVAPFYKRIPAQVQSTTDVTGTLNWVADFNVATEQIPNGSFTFHAEGYDATGNCVARSDSRSIAVNYASSNSTVIAPAAVNITSPLSNETVSGTQEIINGEITNLPAGYQIQDVKVGVYNSSYAGGPFDAPALDSSNLLLRQAVFDSTKVPNGAYSVKMIVHYKDINGTVQSIESPLVSVNVQNATTSPTANANTSASGTNANASTVPVAQPTIPTIVINSPANLSIFRRDDLIMMKATSTVGLSSCSFLILKSGETTPQIKASQAPDTTDKPVLDSTGAVCEYGWDLKNFDDGNYQITVEGWQSNARIIDQISVMVQKFSSDWIKPSGNEQISGNTPLEMDIRGIYERDNKTPVKGLMVQFYQTNTQSPFTEFYNEQLYKDQNSSIWRLYDWQLNKEKFWNTANSNNGKYRLVVKIINPSVSAATPWFVSEPIFIEVSNSIASNTIALNNNNNNNQSAGVVPANENKSVNRSVVNNNANIIDSNGGVADPSTADNNKNKDTDKDGLTDYEEINIYRTDPLKADTDGDGYSDFVEVSTGHNPLKSSSDQTAAPAPKVKPIEEPKTAGTLDAKLLLITAVKNVAIRTSSAPTELVVNLNSAVNGVNANASINNEGSSQAESNKIFFQGKGPANTVLTLFIYSNDPVVVTVKTDEDGNWIYDLDKPLEDGEHQLYVTITDDTGKIQSKSDPMSFFVKQAQAVSPEQYGADKDIKEAIVSRSTNVYLVASGALVFIALIAGIFLSLRKKRNDAPLS